jgi:hypothetical protein
MVAPAFKRHVARPVGPIVTEPTLLVFKEKHGERYFNIPDDTALFAACLKVVSERLKEECWYLEPDGEVPKTPDFTREQIASMPESMRADAEKKLAAYIREMQEFNEEIADFAKIKEAVESRDGRAAWQIVCDRGRYEYEGYSLERFESIGEG